jgi:hypothetical protein
MAFFGKETATEKTNKLNIPTKKEDKNETLY